MKKVLKFIMYSLFVYISNLAKAQNNKLSFEFSCGQHFFSMENYNRYYIDAAGIENWGFKDGMKKGIGFYTAIKYKPTKLFDIGLSGNYQSGKTIGSPEMKIFNIMGEVIETHYGDFQYKSETIGVGLVNSWYVDHILKFEEKRFRFINRCHLAIELYGGMGFSKMTSDLKYPTYPIAPGNFKIFTSDRDFQSQIALKLEFDYLKSPIIGSIGLKGGYQYFRTKTLKDRLGKEWIVTGNHPINLDFSGFFGAVFLTVGK